MSISRLAVFALSVLFAGDVAAQNAAPAPQAPGDLPLALGDLVSALDRANPELSAARKEVDMRVAAIAPAGALPDPTIFAGYMGGLARAPFFPSASAADSFRRFGASQEFPYPGKRSLRTQVAVADADASRWAVEVTRRRLIAELKSAYFDYLLAEHSLSILARNKERLTQFRQIAEARFSVGQGIQQDVIKAQIEVSLLIERETVLAQMRDTARARINGLLYRQPDAPLTLSTTYERAPLSLSLGELKQLASRDNPALKREEHAIDRQQQSLALAQRDVLPDFAVNFTSQQAVGGMPWMYGFDVMVKVPVYWQRKQRPMIAEAAAGLEGVKKVRDTTLSGSLARLTEQYLAASTSDRLATLYTDSVLPQARLGLESSLASYQVGSADFLTVLTNFMTVLAYELSYEEQLARYHQALAQIEPLVGTDLIH